MRVILAFEGRIAILALPFVRKRAPELTYVRKISAIAWTSFTTAPMLRLYCIYDAQLLLLLLLLQLAAVLNAFSYLAVRIDRRWRFR
jgi:hypothetical protein